MEGGFLRGGSISTTLKDCGTLPIVKDRLIKSRTSSVLIRGKTSLSCLDGMGSKVDAFLKPIIDKRQLEKNGLNIFQGLKLF